MTVAASLPMLVMKPRPVIKTLGMRGDGFWRSDRFCEWEGRWRDGFADNFSVEMPSVNARDQTTPNPLHRLSLILGSSGLCGLQREAAFDAACKDPHR